MSPAPAVKRQSELVYHQLEKAEGVDKAVVFDESDGAEHLRMRRYRIVPDGTVPKHTNGVEHEIHLLTGSCIVGIEDEEYTLTPGDSALIPAGTVHWFQNPTDEDCAFLCTIPADDADLRLVDQQSPADAA